MSTFSVTPRGVITVDTGDIQTDFENAYRGALGGDDVNLDSGSIQGQLVINDTANLVSAMNGVVAVANDYNVYYATGHALDVAASFYGYYRKTAIATVVVATVGGTAGTIIPLGSIASDGNNQYKSLNNIVIGNNGTATVQFQAMNPGPITCPANTLTEIITPVVGWDTVNNDYDGIVGMDAETDNVFRNRITANWLNKRARAILGAIIDNVAALPGVVSVLGRENPNNTELVIDDITLSPHSVYLAIVGGNAVDIAKTIAAQKAMGAATVGNTAVAWVDERIDYQYAYNIQRPTVVPVEIEIQYRANNYTGADIGPQIVNTVMAYIADNPFMIGVTVAGADIAAALAEFNQIDLLAVKVRKSNTDAWADYVTTTISEIASVSATNISTKVIQ